MIYKNKKDMKIKFRKNIFSTKERSLSEGVQLFCAVLGMLLLMMGHFYILPSTVLLTLNVFLDKNNSDKKMVTIFEVVSFIVVFVTICYVVFI